MSYVVVTGASSGIGEEFAKRFAKRGFDLLLVSSNEEKLLRAKEEINEGNNLNILTLALDLSLKDSSKQLYDYVLENKLDVVSLINNAGFGDFKQFLDGNLEKYQKMIDLNDRALMSLSYLFGNYFKQKGFGHIVNIASIAGFMPGPYMSVYYASKAFVLNFSLALKDELEKYNVKVTTICPGPIDTNFWNRADVEMTSFKKKFFTRSVKQIVDSGMNRIDDGGGLLVDGMFNKIAAVSTRLVSKQTLTKIVRLVNQKIGSKGE